MGIDPVLVDDNPTRDGVLATSRGGLELLEDCAVVIKTPGISRYRGEVRRLEESGTLVVGGLGLWLAEQPPERVVCVTGTKGKSTTASLAGHLARGLGLRCFVGGNIGFPPHDPDAPVDVDLWVIEVSSYQATDAAVTPPVVAVTSLHPDHLDWHRTVAAYYRDKLSLTSQPGACLTVAPADDANLRAHQSSLGPEVRWVSADEAAEWTDGLSLIGRHNQTNAAVAAELLRAVGVPGADDPQLLRAASDGYHGLDSRLQVIAQVDGVDFVDDSLSTNVLPTIAALEAFASRPVAVILGGHDRGIDYTSLANFMTQRRNPTLALTIPDSGDRIAALLTTSSTSPVEVMQCDTIDLAVEVGFRWARKLQGVVLLSPAAPSFGVYRDYRHRSQAFGEAVAAATTDAHP